MGDVGQGEANERQMRIYLRKHHLNLFELEVDIIMVLSYNP